MTDNAPGTARENEGNMNASSTDLQGLLLEGDVALVTGAASGIGFAVARLFGLRGARVGLFDVDEAALAGAANSLSGEGIDVLIENGMVQRPADCARAVKGCQAEWGRLDILVNCAGIAGGNAPTWELSDDQWLSTLEVNLTGTFMMCRAAVPVMRAQGYGRVVNIASVAGKEGNPRAAHYSASKAGVIALTKSLGKELAQDGVLVNAITPAVIDTPMVKEVTPEHLQYMRERIPMGRLGTVEEVAELVGFLSSRKLTFTTGAVFDISGGRSTY